MYNGGWQAINGASQFTRPLAGIKWCFAVFSHSAVALETIRQMFSSPDRRYSRDPGYSRAGKQIKKQLANEREITRSGAGNNFCHK